MSWPHHQFILNNSEALVNYFSLMVYFVFICDVHRLLNLSLTSDLVPDQDVIDVIIHVGRNPLGRHLAWRYFREKWDILNSR